MDNSARSDRRPGLRAEQRSLADSRILDGAMAVFAEKGLDATVDDVAHAAGVSRRTVFRHFDSHSELFGAAIERTLQNYEARLPTAPAPGEDWERWLLGVARTMHELNRGMLGRGFWHVHVDWPAANPEVRAALADRAERRLAVADRLACLAWSARGLPGRPESWVIDAFGTLLSGFGTAALSGRSPDEAAEVSARILSAVVSGAAGA